MSKKLILFFLAAPLLIVSCSTQKGAPSTKGTASLQKTLNGLWTLNTGYYEGNEGKFTSVLFNDADSSCFEGSDWFFRNNNNTGSYVLNDGAICTEGERFI